MKEIRCAQCARKLAEGEFVRMVIKCPRCGAMNFLKVTEPLTSAARPQLQVEQVQ